MLPPFPVLLVVAASLATDAGPPTALGAGPDSVPDRLERRIPALMDSARIPGVSAAFVRDGGVAWTGAFGARNAGTGAPVTRRTVFQAASLSKPVFAYLVLRLAERGVLDLDRPLHEYAPNSRMDHDPRYRRITARTVLSHSTGLPNWGGDTLELAFEPGSGFRYSGEGYVYLQEVVESRTGLGLGELARREVFEPLGMTRTGYVWEARFADDAAVGHGALGRPRDLQRRSEANAAASLLTTAEDYGRFVAAVLRGRGLEPRRIEEMTRARVEAGETPWAAEGASPGIAWALGWGVERGDGGRGPLVWHWGDNGTFKAYVAALPREGEAVVYFANSTHGVAIAGAVVREALGRPARGAVWAGYQSYDDPDWTARWALHDAFVEGGPGAGLARLAELRSDRPDVVDAELVTGVASLLTEGERHEAAVSLLGRARELLAGSTEAEREIGDALARTLLDAGRFEGALETYREMADGAGSAEEAERFRERARWVETRLRAEEAPVRIPRERLRELAGEYGPRRVTLEEDTLWYQREGNPRYRLLPLAPDLFQPVGLEDFRIRFVGPDDGPPEEIVGVRMDGGRDVTPRTGG